MIFSQIICTILLFLYIGMQENITSIKIKNATPSDAVALVLNMVMVKTLGNGISLIAFILIWVR